MKNQSIGQSPIGSEDKKNSEQASPNNPNYQ
jgi:hypothetical protein